MHLYTATEECPGCGVFFEATAELVNVDFSGKEFTRSKLEDAD